MLALIIYKYDFPPPLYHLHASEMLCIPVGFIGSDIADRKPSLSRTNSEHDLSVRIQGRSRQQADHTAIIPIKELRCPFTVLDETKDSCWNE